MKAACTLYPWGPMLPPPAQVSGGAEREGGGGEVTPGDQCMLPPPAQVKGPTVCVRGQVGTLGVHTLKLPPRTCTVI